MSRLVALTVAIALGVSPLTYAGEGVMQSASRIVRQQVAANKAEVKTDSGLASRVDSPTIVTFQAQPRFAALQGGAPVLSKTGMRTRTKVMIYLAAGVGLGATAWAIDHKVLDVTPSTLGTRQDGCKPFCGSPSQ